GPRNVRSRSWKPAASAAAPKAGGLGKARDEHGRERLAWPPPAFTYPAASGLSFPVGDFPPATHLGSGFLLRAVGADRRACAANQASAAGRAGLARTRSRGFHGPGERGECVGLLVPALPRGAPAFNAACRRRARPRGRA